METLRPLLVTYAYNIIGSLEDAKDVVQDAFLRYESADTEDIENKKAYLVRIVVNLAINFKKKLKRTRATYTGQWLPEPVATETADGGIKRKEILSYSLMVLLEKLNPVQRAVFILKEAFDYDHAEIAAVLDITEEYARKILSRARAILHGSSIDRPATEVPAKYLSGFLEVLETGDTGRLEKLLKEDISVISDGGGRKVAFMNIIHGRESVRDLLVGLYKKFYNPRMVDVRETVINHQPALLYYEGETLATCQVFEIVDGKIVNMFYMRNPDKLGDLRKIF